MQNFPTLIVDRFWQDHQPTLSRKFKNKVDFLDQLKSKDPEYIEFMANDIYERGGYEGKLDRADFDMSSGLETWRDAQPTWVETVGQNMAMRAVDLGAGLLRAVDEAAWWLEDKIPLGTFDLGPPTDEGPASRPPPQSRPMFQMAAEDLEEVSDKHTLDPRVSWDEFKESPAIQFLPFAMEQGLISVPDMVAAMTVLPVYVAARTGEIGQERAENDLRDQATAGDMIRALPAAAASAMLDRFGAQKMFGLTDELKDTTLKEIGKAVGRRAGIESATEAMQEPIETVGGAAGTERWKRMSAGEIASELGEASLQGAVVGAGFGGSVSVPSLAMEAGRHKARAGGQGELPADIEREVQTQKEAAREFAESNKKAKDEAVKEGKPPPRPKREPEEPAGAAPAGPTPAGPTPGGPTAAETAVDEAPLPNVPEDDQTVMSDAERSIESLTLEEEASLNKRRPLTPLDVAQGDRVVVDDGVQPTIGTVEVADDRMVRVVDDDGSPITVLRPDRPLPSDSRMYSLSQEQMEEDRDVELEAATEEMGRLIKRAADNPDDEASVESLRKLRNGKEFAKLPQSSRDQIDNFIGEADQRKVKKEEEAKAAEEKAKADEKKRVEEEKAKQKEEDEFKKFNDQWVTEQEKRSERHRPIASEVLGELGYKDLREVPPEERVRALARLKGEVERRNTEATEKAEREETERVMQGSLREMNRLVERTRKDPTDMAAVEAVRKFRNSDQFQTLTEESRNELDDYLRDLDTQALAREEAKKAEAPAPKVRPPKAPTLEPEPAPEPEPVETPNTEVVQDEEAPTEEVISAESKIDKSWGAENKVFTRDRYEAARARLRDKMNQMGAGIDPEMLQIGVEVAGYHIESGARKFTDFSKSVVEDVGEWARPYLRSWYEAARYWPEFEAGDMTPGAEIEAEAAAAEAAPEPEAEPETVPEPEPAPEPEPEPEPEPAPEPEPEPAPEPEAAPEQDDTPYAELATSLEPLIGEALKQGKTITNPQLFKAADKVFGGTVGEDAYSPQDAYNAVELAVNRLISRANYDAPTVDAATAHVRNIEKINAILPVQSRRTADKVAFQQFSTPPAYSYVANWAANIQPGDKVLEPSAGNGGLAVIARAMGGEVDVNEIDPARAENLATLGFTPSMEDGEQLANIMEPESYDVVVMNPPFSSAGTRGAKGNNIGARHVMQAAEMLRPGGRLVAIMGQGFTPEAQSVSDAFDKMGKEGEFRAVVHVDGSKIYRKYGTTFNNQIIVWDKTGKPTDWDTVERGDPESMKDGISGLQYLVMMMEGARNARDTSMAADGDRQTVPGTGEGTRGPVAGDPDMATGTPRQPAPGAGTKSKPARDRSKRQRDPGLRDQPTGGARNDGAVPGGPGTGGVGGGSPAGRRDGGSPGPRNGTGLLDSGEQRHESRVAATVEPEVAGNFATYKPQKLKIKGAKPHPGKLVESAAMASVLPPDPSYKITVPKEVVTDGKLSDAQLEAVVYAGQAHSKVSDDGVRRGYFIGDGTGVGKGREVAGIIMDNWNKGRKRAIWVSEKAKLLKDAERDAEGIGLSPDVPIYDGTDSKKTRAVGDKFKDGVVFTTYTNMRSKGTKEEKANDPEGWPNLDALVDWVGGTDFDGVLAFDEAHTMKNAGLGSGAKSKPSKIFEAGAYLQSRLPKARVVYVSATGASNPGNLGYLERLQLWGKDAPFDNPRSMVSEIESGGVATMELIARDLKQMGLYTARSISYEGVEYERLTHTLTDDQRQMYNVSAQAWQGVLQNMDAAIDALMPGAAAKDKKKAFPTSHFWGANQRFFNQVLTSMQMPSVIKSIEQDIKDGYAPVIQLTSTGEAAVNRAKSSLKEDEDFEDLDVTPRQLLIDLVDKTFPTQQMQEIYDESGRPKWVPALDSKGKPVKNRDAERTKKQLLAQLGSVTLPGNPLDMILEAFGYRSVSEISGRTTRLVRGSDGKLFEQRRTKTQREAETQAFQDGDTEILVFSAAGGTGASYHADREAKNQKRRMHYILQAGWQADGAVQGFGRTHRANESSQPVYRLVETDLASHKRFVSTIASRLDQLGALTKGQRDASASVFSAEDNLDNEYAQQAVTNLFEAVRKGDGVMSVEDVKLKMGLDLPEDGNAPINVETKQFLNRLLSLNITDQAVVFEDFMARMDRYIEAAKDAGKYDRGIEQIEGISVRVGSREVIYQDKETGSETEYVELEIDRENELRDFNQVLDRERNGDMIFVVNKRSQRAYAMVPMADSTDIRSGGMVRRYKRYAPERASDIAIPEENFKMAYESKSDYYDIITDRNEARRLWEADMKKAPAVRTQHLKMLSGALLPIYGKIIKTIGSGTVFRAVLDDGTSVLGRAMTTKNANKILNMFGSAAKAKDVPPKALINTLMDHRGRATLTTGETLKVRKVSGEDRIEVISRDYDDIKPGGRFDRMGFQSEMSFYKQRYFVPKIDGETPLAKLLKIGKVAEIHADDGGEIFEIRNRQGSPRMRNKIAGVTAHQSLSREELEEAVAEIADQLAPQSDVYTMTRKTAQEALDVEGNWQGGAALDGLESMIFVAIDTEEDPRTTVRHEAIHALRDLGLFTAAEWSVLRNAALNDGWMKKHRIRQRYANFFDADGNPNEDAIEEAVAEEFAFYMREEGQDPRSAVVRRTFKRMRDFFVRLVHNLRMMGMTPKPGNIFDLVEAGVVGDRPIGSGEIRGNPGMRARKTEPEAKFSDPETEKRWQEASKGVNETSIHRGIEAIKEEWKKMTRSRPHMPETKAMSDAREKLIHLEQAEHSAKEQIAALFKRVMGGLPAADIDLLTRKMVLDDLLWSSEQGMDLPFGLKGQEDVLDALQAVEAVLDKRPELIERMNERTLARDRLKEDMVRSGVLTYKQARNPHYFRHQVLEYAAARNATGRAAKVRSTYWHPRRGSEKDINANYFQAEADWMYKAYQDVGTANFLGWLRSSKYNAKRQLVQKAKAANNERLNELTREDKDLAKQWSKVRQNVGMSLSMLRKAVGDVPGLRSKVPPNLHRQLDDFIRGGGNRAVPDEGGNSNFFGLIQWLADSDVPGVNKQAGFVLGAVFAKRSFIKNTLKDDYVNPQNMQELIKKYAPDTHSAWQADSFDGKTRAVHIFTGKTVAEHVLDRALDKLDSVIGGVMTEEQVAGVKDILENKRDVRMIGGPMEEMVLPVEISATLNEFYDEGTTSMMDALAVQVTGRWKQWTLFNPARFAKYYLNNVTGDMDALLASRKFRPIAKKLPQAFKDVHKMVYKNKVEGDLVSAMDKGVIQSSLVMQEIQGMGPAMSEAAFRPERVKGVLKAGTKYFDQVQKFARLRENAFRYAAYLHYKEELGAGKTLLEIGYGATPPWMAEGITDKEDLAARLARDTLGDYGAIPYRAKWARKRLIPFVSWIASNTTRYVNLFRNAYLTGRDVSKSKGIAMGAYASAGLATRIFLLYGAVQLWNNLLFPEDEELLGSEERRRMHLNLGRWGDEVVTLRFQGAFSDFAGWFGFEDAGAVISEIQAGRADFGDIIRAIAAAPANRIGQAITPLYKLPVELGLNKSFFPDIFNPRSIRDRERHAARTFSLDYPTALIKQMMGESAPVKPVEKIVAGALVYTRDPGKMAYDQIRGKAFSFIENETGGSVEGRMGGRSQALYNWRVARKQGDKRSEKLAMEELRSYGAASASSLRSSIKRAQPLGMFPNKKLRQQFMLTLSARERDILKRAQLWYRQTFGSK